MSIAALPTGARSGKSAHSTEAASGGGQRRGPRPLKHYAFSDMGTLVKSLGYDFNYSKKNIVCRTVTFLYFSPNYLPQPFLHNNKRKGGCAGKMQRPLRMTKPAPSPTCPFPRAAARAQTSHQEPRGSGASEQRWVPLGKARSHWEEPPWTLAGLPSAAPTSGHRPGLTSAGTRTGSFNHHESHSTSPPGTAPWKVSHFHVCLTPAFV